MFPAMENPISIPVMKSTAGIPVSSLLRIVPARKANWEAANIVVNMVSLCSDFKFLVIILFSLGYLIAFYLVSILKFSGRLEACFTEGYCHEGSNRLFK